LGHARSPGNSLPQYKRSLLPSRHIGADVESLSALASFSN
jgi:hypothetical protein